MKTNLRCLTWALALISSASLRADVTQFSVASFGVEQELLFTPVNPDLSLEKAPVDPQVQEADFRYPHVNPSIAGDLCGIEGPPVLDPKVRRHGSHLSLELAAREATTPEIALKRAQATLPVLLVAPWLLLCRRRS